MMHTDSYENAGDNSVKSMPSANGNKTQMSQDELALKIAKQIESNYQINDRIFATVLRNFQWSYYSRLVGYWGLLILAIGSLLTTLFIVTSYGLLRIVFVLVIVNIIAFIVFLNFQRTQPIERTLFYMMWLDIIHNSYVSSLLWLTDNEDALASLTQATDQASQQLQALLDHYTQSTNKRFSISQYSQKLKD